MKLISKTLIYYLLISLPLLVLAGLFSYFLIKAELRDGTDETLISEKINAEKLIRSVKPTNTIYLSSDSLSNIRVKHSSKPETEFIDTILNRIPPTPPNYLTIVKKNIKGDFSDINPIDLEAGANRCAIS